MTPEEAIKALQEQQHNDDTEFAHILADAALCKLLIALGYPEVVAEWEKVERWYS